MGQQNIVYLAEEPRRLDRFQKHSSETGIAIGSPGPMAIIVGDCEDRNVMSASFHGAHASKSAKFAGCVAVDIDEHHIHGVLAEISNCFCGGVREDCLGVDYVKTGSQQSAFNVVFLYAKDAQRAMAAGQIDHEKAMLPAVTRSSTKIRLVNEWLMF